jgi:hypothetical protein
MTMRSRALLAVSSVVGLALAASPARAQMPPPPEPTVLHSSGSPLPDRILPDSDNLGTSTRPADLTPDGINFDDCIQDQTLQFALTLTGFNGESLEAWASTSSDCTQDANRSGPTPTCWLVASAVPALTTDVPTAETFDIRVQDLVGSQTSPPTGGTYQKLGASACNAQPTFAAVPLTVYFLPVMGNAFVTGSIPLDYPIATDLVGPPAPTGLSLTPGNAILFVDWNPNADSDTIGYDLFTEPPPGEAADASASTTTPTPTLVCDDAGTSPDSGADCFYVSLGNPANNVAGGVCNAPDLTIGGGSGVASIYMVPAGSMGVDVLGESTGAYTITGLTNGTTYAAVVAAVDAFGNVGPSSAPVCDYPSATLHGFGQTDGGQTDGGQAGGKSGGGGGCALAAVGPSGADTAMAFAFFGVVGMGLRSRRSRRCGDGRRRRHVI